MMLGVPCETKQFFPTELSTPWWMVSKMGFIDKTKRPHFYRRELAYRPESDENLTSKFISRV